VTSILADHNVEGQAELLLGVIAAAGWLELVPIRLVTFADVGLRVDSSDRVIWRFAQERDLLLLTDNRNMDDDDALERTMREEATPDSLPVLTIGNLRRVAERAYRLRCAERIVEIVVDLERYRGGHRVFIP
jgi:predicted nuclease of predicted toxin-antitoxin system